MLVVIVLLTMLIILQVVDLQRMIRHGSRPQSSAARTIAWMVRAPQWRVMNIGLVATNLTCAFLMLRPTHRRRLRVAKGQCPWCGYERHGLPRALVCPECGRSPRRRERPSAQQSGPA
jgi:hypothetical protein